MIINDKDIDVEDTICNTEIVNQIKYLGFPIDNKKQCFRFHKIKMLVNLLTKYI